MPSRDTVEKSPKGLFRRTSAPRALIVSYADNECARIEVFFAPGNPWQKTDNKSSLREQIRVFRQSVGRAIIALPLLIYCLVSPSDC